MIFIAWTSTLVQLETSSFQVYWAAAGRQAIRYWLRADHYMDHAVLGMKSAHPDLSIDERGPAVSADCPLQRATRQKVCDSGSRVPLKTAAFSKLVL